MTDKIKQLKAKLADSKTLIRDYRICEQNLREMLAEKEKELFRCNGYSKEMYERAKKAEKELWKKEVMLNAMKSDVKKRIENKLIKEINPVLFNEVDNLKNENESLKARLKAYDQREGG